jgi:hypothetical protein
MNKANLDKNTSIKKGAEKVTRFIETDSDSSSLKSSMLTSSENNYRSSSSYS